MNIDEARQLARMCKTGFIDEKERLELLANMLVQAYELGWAHGRLAREAAAGISGRVIARREKSPSKT